MLAVTAYLVVAGAVLSMVVRLAGFGVILAAILVILLVAALSFAGAFALPTFGWKQVVIAIVALQAGYGAGVLLRALYHHVFSGSRNGASPRIEDEI